MLLLFLFTAKLTDVGLGAGDEEDGVLFDDLADDMEDGLDEAIDDVRENYVWWCGYTLSLPNHTHTHTLSLSPSLSLSLSLSLTHTHTHTHTPDVNLLHRQKKLSYINIHGV